MEIYLLRDMFANHMLSPKMVIVIIFNKLIKINIMAHFVDLLLPFTIHLCIKKNVIK